MRMGSGLAGFAFFLLCFGPGLLPAEELKHEFVVDRNFYYKTGQQAALSTEFDFNEPEELKDFPLAFGEWKGEELLVANQPVVKPDFMFERDYRNGDGESVWFQLIRGRIERAVHVPAICYYNAGWQILEQKSDSIRVGEYTVPCGRMAVRRGPSYGTELYFYLWGDPGRNFMKGCVMFRIASLGAEEGNAEKVRLIKGFVRDVLRQAGQTP